MSDLLPELPTYFSQVTQQTNDQVYCEEESSHHLVHVDQCLQHAVSNEGAQLYHVLFV